MSRSHPNEAAAGEAFWRFSLAFYARPEAAAALLALQDRAGLDVNLTLLGLWLGISRNRRLAARELVAAKAAAAPVSDGVVAPLRHLRRQLKDTADHDLAALRRRIVGLELAAERRVQYRLAAQFAGISEAGADTDPDRFDTAMANLALYLGAENGSAEARVLQAALAALTRTGQPGNSRRATP